MGLYVRTILCFFVLIAYMNVAFAATAVTPNQSGRIITMQKFMVGMALYCSHKIVLEREDNKVVDLYNSFLQTNAPIIRRAQAVFDKVVGMRAADTIATRILNKTQHIIHSIPPYNEPFSCKKIEDILIEINQYNYNNNPAELAETFDKTGLEYNSFIKE